MKRALLALLAAVTVLALAVPVRDGRAHAALVASEPAANAFLRQAPAEVILDFTEPIDPRASAIRLLDGAGREIAIGAPVVTQGRMRAKLPALEPGIYNVIWNNVSLVDGHALTGSYPFTVLNPDGTVPDAVNTVGAVGSGADRLGRPDGTATRLLALLGLMLTAGAGLVTLLWPEAPVSTRRRLGQAAALGAAACVVAAGLSLALLLETYSGVGAAAAVFETRFGRYWLARALLAAAAAGAAALYGRRPRAAAWALIALAAGQLVTFTATSHAAAVPGSAWAMAIDFAHAAAAVGWLGAVAGTVVAARFGRRRDAWRPMMRRFARLASVLVFVLLATGLLGALIHIDSVQKLTETRYGLVLLAKLALAAPLLAVALYNARWGKARLVGERPGEPRRFMFGAAAEVALGVAVVGAAALMSQTTTSRSIVIEPERRPFEMTAPASDLQVTLRIDPNQTGLNTYRVALADGSGAPVDAQRVRLVFRYQEDQSLGPSTLVLAPVGQGEFGGQGPYMPLEGRWRVEVEVRRADADDARTFFDVRPAGAFAAAVSRGGGAWSLPTAGLTWNQFGGLVLLLAGLGFALSRGTARELNRRLGWAASTGTMAGFGLGVLLLFGVHAHEPQAGLPTNPVFPDADSIARGRALYEANCIACHGRTGVPPPGLDLNPYPLDLTVHVPQHPDGQLFRFIADGIPGTAMPAWKEQGLTDEEIWHLVNYLRTLAPATQ
ncbi:copper resistance protein CopC [Tepidiforma sp.]|jgi:copper transport protein|uniref:copper resistance protein CopC n=1 Tax=Tepidiforma sp. TaxID=2682230 RepID=UPI00261D5953|nr:copper resistance protein CopC [Tepidiforma sp.]MCX7617521.1 copper resistance protein CopC [Tepidiforma sp.]